MMSAAVPIAMPIALIDEMMLITLCDFLAKRYLPAINGASLILVIPDLIGNLFLQQFLNMLHVVKRTVEVECYFRNNTELLADLVA